MQEFFKCLLPLAHRPYKNKSTEKESLFINDAVKPTTKIPRFVYKRYEICDQPDIASSW